MAISDDNQLKAFLDDLCAMPDSAVDYQNAPRTTAEDWADAEVLLPVTRDEFDAIQDFIAARRAERTAGPAHPAGV